MRSVDGRIRDLIDRTEQIRGLTADHQDFQTWRAKAQNAINEKLGEKSDLALQMRSLTFRLSERDKLSRTTSNPAAAYARDIAAAVGLLEAAFESEKAPMISPRGHGGTIINIDNSPSITANVSATAQVTIDGSADQLRRLLAEAPGLDREERGAAVAAVPDDDEAIDLATVETLLSIATKARPLLDGIAGWIVANMDRLPSF